MCVCVNHLLDWSGSGHACANTHNNGLLTSINSDIVNPGVVKSLITTAKFSTLENVNTRDAVS